MIRSLMHGQQFCGEFEGKTNFMIEGEVWQQIGHMCKFSVYKKIIFTDWPFRFGLS